jgi:hypothetical protein
MGIETVVRLVARILPLALELRRFGMVRAKADRNVAHEYH